MITIANNKNMADCINLSKASWPQWRSNNEKLGKKHIKDCIKGKRCLVVIQNKEIIAFLVWGTLWNKIHIQDVFVKEKYRKNAIATELMQRVIKIGKKQGFKEIISDADVSNKPAINFHMKCGFQKSGLIKNNWDNEDSYTFSMKI
jgi:ribosomal protein S18 acetylase RimI-like enzyme